MGEKVAMTKMLTVKIPDGQDRMRREGRIRKTP